MDAGRELDALIAEKVMGWQSVTFRRTADGTLTGKHPDGYIDDVPPYSTDIAAAWQVVEIMRKREGVIIHVHEKDMASCWIAQYAGVGFTASLAICLAALKAVGAEVQ